MAGMEVPMAEGSLTQVYVVTSGEYSDYRVDAIYLDPDLAEQHVAMIPRGDHGRVRVYPVRRVLPVKAMRVARHFSKDANADDITYELGPDLVFADDIEEVDAREGDNVIIVEGYDRALVDKVYGERVARWKADQAGIT
jgi:hypothetical protein